MSILDIGFARSRIVSSLNLRYAVSLIWSSGPGLALVSLFLVALQGAIPLVLLYLTKQIVDTVSGSIPYQQKLHQSLILIVATVLFALFNALCRSLSSIVGVALSQAVADKAHDQIHRKAISVDLECYEDAKYYDILHRAKEETAIRSSRALQGITQVAQSTISLLAIGGLLVSYNWGIGAVLIIAAIPGLVVRVRYAKQVYEWDRAVTNSRRRAWYFSSVLMGQENAKEVRVYGLGDLFIGLYQDICGKLRHARMQLAIRHLSSELAAEISSIMALFGSYALVINDTVLGKITVGSMVMFFQAFQQGLYSLQRLLISLSDLYEDNLFLESMHEFLSLETKLPQPEDPKPIANPITKGFALHEVSFIYPDSDQLAIDKISLTINPGEVVALVGHNGSGKSTLIKLLCRLYDPNSGSVTIDGTDLREVSVNELHRRISVIFQDYARYQMTALENIWLGDVEAQRDRESIMNAAERSGADEAIVRLKHGYDTLLGRSNVGGEELSIGEWQKVALARAFLRDADLVILDEPTSAVDPDAEYEFFKNFKALIAGKSAILISHRFSTVRMADRIYVMQKGKIAEQGSHDELVSMKGVYADMFAKQAECYR